MTPNKVGLTLPVLLRNQPYKCEQRMPLSVTLIACVKTAPVGGHRCRRRHVPV